MEDGQMVERDPKEARSPLDEATTAAYAEKAKKLLRGRMKAVRSGHSLTSLARRSEAIVQRLEALPVVREARAVALFWPILESGEVDLRALDTLLRERNVEVFYPFMDRRPEGGYQTGFRLTQVASELRDRGQRFFEPGTGPWAKRGQLDLVFVPALAADANGNRIGYGAGYYDATLRDVCPPAKSIIVAYQCQMLAELPVQRHDVSCDMVVTDAQSYPPV